MAWEVEFGGAGEVLDVVEVSERISVAQQGALARSALVLWVVVGRSC